jgi:hypothetical protein
MAVEPADKYAMAFVDGQNLYQHAKAAFGHHHPNYDLLNCTLLFAQSMGGNRTLCAFTLAFPALSETLCGPRIGQNGCSI